MRVFPEHLGSSQFVVHASRYVAQCIFGIRNDKKGTNRFSKSKFTETTVMPRVSAAGKFKLLDTRTALVLFNPGDARTEVH